MIRSGSICCEHLQSVLIANSFDDVFEYAFVIRETVALDCTAEIIAEYPSEVFVSCVRQEAS